MAGRIVLFGATGYTGRLTAKALVERGQKPLLAGRSADSLARLAAELGNELETQTADVSDPASVRALLSEGDVMLSTVGPFTHWGNPAVEAAIGAGVPYLDSTGEPPFIRRVFETYGPQAADAGAPLLTAMGYDWVPGNLAAALALSEAGDSARTIEIAYFLTGGGGGASGGTMASVVASLLEPGFAYRNGRIVTEASGTRVRSFDLGGRKRQAVSAASTEHFTIPAQFGHVRNVEAYLGWFGPASRPLQASSYLISGLTKIGPAKAGLERLLGRFAKGSTGGPSEEDRNSSGSQILAIARDSAGEALAEVELKGVNSYTFTAGILAWASSQALAGAINGVGAIGPAQAFGIKGLEQGAAEAGITRA